MTAFDRFFARHLGTLGLAALVAAGCSGTKPGPDTGSSSDTDTVDPPTDTATVPTGPTTDTSTTTPGPTTTTFAGVCAGDPPPPGYVTGTGFVTVAPGNPCPDVADAILEVHACIFWDWVATCSFVGVTEDQVYVNDGYSSEFVDVGSTPTWDTSPGPVVDVCTYTGVFFDDTSITCGRPLLAEDGRPVLAPPLVGAGWAGEDSPDLVGLSEGERHRLYDHWSAVAAMEHASVASFAVVALELKRVGAPPHLIEAVHRAGLQEVVHARRAYALASAYAGHTLGPGPLHIPGFVLRDRKAMAEALVREGCVGETLAAVDAALRYGGATDLVVRDVLEQVVRDEADHASLAWRTLAWMLATDDGTVVQHLDGVFAQIEAQLAAWPAPSDPTAAERGHGLVCDHVRARFLHDAFFAVVRPAWASVRSGA